MMSDAADLAADTVRKLRARQEALEPLEVVRASQDGALEQIAPDLLPELHWIDEEFDTVVRVTSNPQALPAGPRLVTPWPDGLALLASLLAFAFAANVGRIAGRAALEQIPFVAPLVAALSVIALAGLLWGALQAKRERDVLIVQREESKASTRSMFLIVTVVFLALTLIAMLVRVFAESVTAPWWTTVALLVALAVSMLLILAITLAVRAYRFAKSTPAEGKFISRVKVNPVQAAEHRRLEASWNSADRAIGLAEAAGVELELRSVHTATVTAIEEAAILKQVVLKRLRTLSWAEARYAVDFIREKPDVGAVRGSGKTSRP